MSKPPPSSVFAPEYGWQPSEPKQRRPRYSRRGLEKKRAKAKLHGRFRLRHFRKGELIEDEKIDNLITNAGRAAIAGLIIATGHTNAFDYVAIGTGTTAATNGDTTLETEITTGGGARTLATLARVTTDTSNDTAQLKVTFTFTASFAVTEAGVFDSSASGTMLSRQTFTARNVVSEDALEVTWEIDVD